MLRKQRKKKKQFAKTRAASDRFRLPPGSEPRADLPPGGSPQWHALVRPQNFAFYRGIDTLYKFRAFTSKKDESRLREIVEQHTVYFSPRDRLNDMFDMAVRHEIRGDKAKPATRRRVLRDLERLMREHTPPLTEADIQKQLDLTRTADLIDLERQATEQSRTRLAKEFPIFCLSSDNTRPAQWAYYAGDNTGVCIHFDSRIQSRSPFAFARMVEYQEKRPSLPIPLTLDHNEVARRVALIKHLDWQHEREYRVLGHSDIGINFTSYDGRRGEFAAPLILGITVGNRMKRKKVDVVRKMASEHTPQIPVFRANPRPDTFNCSIDPL